MHVNIRNAKSKRCTPVLKNNSVLNKNHNHKNKKIKNKKSSN